MVKTIWIRKREVVTLHDRDEAKLLIRTMDESVRSVMATSNQHVQRAIRQTLSGFEEDVADITKDLNERVEDFDSRMKDQGFQLQLRIPEARIGRLPAIARNIMNQVLEEEEYTEIKRRHRKGLWGGICSLLGTEEWGTEEYSETRDRFVIDLRKAKETVSKGVEGTYRKLNEHAKKHIEDTLGKATNDLFADARKMVERIRGDLIRSRNQIGLEAEEKRGLARQLGAFKRRGRDIGTDCEGLRSDLGGLA